MRAWIQACSAALVLLLAQKIVAQNSLLCHGPAYTLKSATALASTQTLVIPPPGLNFPFQIYENYSDGYSALLSIRNNRVTAKVLMGVNMTANYISGGPLNVTGVYRLVAYEFFMPSQFSIDGRLFAFEAHLIHSNVNNGSDTLVVVLLFEAGGFNPLLDDLLPPKSIANQSLPVTLHLKKYLPAYQNYYYLGPQTITQANRNVYGSPNPNCSYSVAQTWLLMETPLNCSLAQLQRVQSLAFPSPVAPAGSVPPSTQPTTFPKYVSQRVVPFVPFVEDVFKPSTVFAYVWLGVSAIVLFCWIHNKRRQAYLKSLSDQV